MKVLLDENVPRYLKRELATLDVFTLADMGWTGIKNGVLLNLAVNSDFAVFLTCDRKIEHQQNVSGLRIAVVMLAVSHIRRQEILALAPDLVGHSC